MMFAWAAVCVLTLAGCSGTPVSSLSPTGASPTDAALNPDGSSLKVNKPTNLAPNNATVDSLRPTLSFNAATGVYTASTHTHELEVVNANGNVVYSRTAAGSPHTLESDLSYSDNFWFRVRARLGNDVGPWSDYAQFRTPDPPSLVPVQQGSSGLPFPVPAECGPGGPGNRFGCVAAIAAVSAEWGRCRAGDGVGCHRFTRQVAYALSQSDGNWTNILAAPGGHACHCGGCGASDGTMFREDTVVYGGRQVFDMITGAGGPSPGLSWSSVPGPRAGDLPILAPLCN
jgi:hypothetical protein